MTSRIPPQSLQKISSSHLDTTDLILNKLSAIKQKLIENAKNSEPFPPQKDFIEINNLLQQLPDGKNSQILQQDSEYLSSSKNSHLALVNLIEAGVEMLPHPQQDLWEINTMIKITQCIQTIIQNPNANHQIIADLTEHLWSLKSQLREHDENQKFTEAHSEASDILDHMTGLETKSSDYFSNIENYLSELSPTLSQMKDSMNQK